MIETIFQYIYEFKIENAYKLLNSQFMSSVIGALAGAFAGAYVAHKIASNAKRRELLEAQMRSTNVAISSAFLTCNSLLALKGQHVKSLYDNYIYQKEKFEAALKNPPANGIILFEMDLKTLRMPFVPFDDVSRRVQEQINVRGRPLALVSTIQNSLDSLKHSFEQRNTIIKRFKTDFNGVSEEIKLKIYFGVRLQDGSIHQEYDDIIQIISKYTDDVIFFSSLLCSDLVAHGDNIRTYYKKRFGKHLEKTASPDFKTEKAENLMPDVKDYEDWLMMFKVHPQKQSWFKRLWILISRSKPTPKSDVV
ncbi:hypothetical protein SAMN05421830_10683 [Desulfomicrobium norvegicum]|uniref:Uncharacterized protein n=1 Tax=Desulfomicrobium norvegicum (strain DSM 1741 / NCIMB 8310) TaxID=52561 RepID=A0A8G2C361_DESNO|nr:hypothetical protein [Desulfomicrobium norvegicum]SFL77561.1 hypothetical protein SAMN05421830_10683 [Desulfomicrobium norvegicum]